MAWRSPRPARRLRARGSSERWRHGGTSFSFSQIRAALMEAAGLRSGADRRGATASASDSTDPHDDDDGLPPFHPPTPSLRSAAPPLPALSDAGTASRDGDGRRPRLCHPPRRRGPAQGVREAQGNVGAEGCPAVRETSKNLCRMLFETEDAIQRWPWSIDDRLQVWDEKDQPRVHVVPAYTPYYAPQAEMENAVPVLCVAGNISCSIRGGFLREFDESLIKKVPVRD